VRVAGRSRATRIDRSPQRAISRGSPAGTVRDPRRSRARAPARSRARGCRADRPRASGRTRRRIPGGRAESRTGGRVHHVVDAERSGVAERGAHEMESIAISRRAPSAVGSIGRQGPVSGRAARVGSGGAPMLLTTRGSRKSREHHGSARSATIQARGPGRRFRGASPRRVRFSAASPPARQARTAVEPNC